MTEIAIDPENQMRQTWRVFKCMMIALDSIDLAAWPEQLRPLAEATRQQIEVSAAAAQLAGRRRDAKARRRRRVYTGVVGGHRAWRGMKVVLPGGNVGELLMSRRGAALVRWRDEFAIKPEQIGACSTAELRPFKLPSAALLGSLKRGKTERPSAKKARTSRINGHAPPRPGSRPRGRPRSTNAPAVAGLAPS